MCVCTVRRGRRPPDLLQVLDEPLILQMTLLVGSAQNCGRVNSRSRSRSPRMFHKQPALFGQTIVGSENRLRGSRAETDNDFGLDCGKFRFKPRPARLDFGSARFLVNPALAALFELKMFDGVGYINDRPVNTSLLQRAIEQTAGRTNEGTSHSIFLVARLLADKHDRSRWRTFAEHRLCSVLIEVASTARLNSFAQNRNRLSGRNKIGGAP